MKDKDDIVKKLGFVSCKYLINKLGINSMDLYNLKSYGIVRCHKNSEGTIIRGYYTYESYKKLKEFMEEYKGYFGHSASLKACLLAFEKKGKKL